MKAWTTRWKPRLKRHARVLGFDLVGIAPAAPADGFDRLRDWLDRGFAGDMAYMHRHAEARRHPESILPDVRSVVMLGMNYNPGRDEDKDERAGTAESPATLAAPITTTCCASG